MGNNHLSVLVSFMYILLLWPHVQPLSAPFKESTGDVITADRGEQRPHVEKRSVQSCDTSFDNYCFNNGQCMFHVDINTKSCKCETGFHGKRCEQLLLVSKPMREDQVALIIVSVILLMIGLAGVLYFFCKWYRRNRPPQQQKRWGYTGVQTA